MFEGAFLQRDNDVRLADGANLGPQQKPNIEHSLNIGVEIVLGVGCRERHSEHELILSLDLGRHHKGIHAHIHSVQRPDDLRLLEGTNHGTHENPTEDRHGHH